MSFNFDEISKKVKQFSKDRVEDVQKLNELRVLNGQISDAGKQIKESYIEIGRKIFEQYKESPLEGFEAEIQSILDKTALIEELKEKKRGVKQVVLCPCCGSEVSVGEKFCPNCGNKMPETEEEDDSETVTDASGAEEAPAEEEAAKEEASVEEEAPAGEAPADEAEENTEEETAENDDAE